MQKSGKRMMPMPPMTENAVGDQADVRNDIENRIERCHLSRLRWSVARLLKRTYLRTAMVPAKFTKLRTPKRYPTNQVARTETQRQQ